MARQLSIAGDIESLRYPSWCLCRLVDRIIGTKEEVSLKRKCDAMHFYVTNCFMSYKMLYSGSMGEGFGLKSSDIDIMVIDQNIVVLESIHNTLPFDDNKTVLLMKRQGCNPGFVILQLINRAKRLFIRESIVDYVGHSVLSSLLYRDATRSSAAGQVGHGPCNTHHYIFDTDTAYCFECCKWPTEANEFIYRHRPYGWPGKCLLDKIVCRGCHLVPIGDKNSDLTHIQWRLSFSTAEKDLVHSFNHTQFLVYGLLKIFLKQFIDKLQFLQGILCSYFMKTAMFYCIENTPLFLWRDDLLIPCFWVCLNKLITWVEQGYCPNYFVPQNNMFRNKVFGEHQRLLLDALNQCKRAGWPCLFLCKALKELQSIASYPETSHKCILIWSDKEIECVLDTITGNLIISRYFSNYREARHATGCALTLFSHAGTQQEREISKLLVYSVLNGIGRSKVIIGVTTNNKKKYRTLRKRQHLLSTSSRNMGYMGMIDMATFYHEIGQYQKAVSVLERVISIWKPYVLFMSRAHKLFFHRDLYQRYVCGKDRSLNEKVRFAIATEIIMIGKLCCPASLRYDVEDAAPFPLILPPLPYAVFLVFLCYHRLGNIDRSLSVLHDLEVLSRDSIQGGRQYPVVYNMLAICLDKLGNRQRAVEMCLLSLKLKPNRNGVTRLLDKILSRS